MKCKAYLVSLNLSKTKMKKSGKFSLQDILQPAETLTTHKTTGLKLQICQGHGRQEKNGITLH